MSDPNFPPPPGGTPPPPGNPGEPAWGTPPPAAPPPSGPPPGNFGAPPPGSPPPPGGFGSPPPPGGFGGPPPPGGFGGDGGFTPPPAQPYGGGGEMPQLDVGSAISYGWKKFSENIGPFVILMVAVFIVSVVLSILQNLLTPDSGGLSSFIISMVLVGITWIVTSIVQAGVWRAGLGVTKGTTPSIEQLTNTDNLVPYILTNVVIGIGFVIGLVLCVLPGIAWLIFTAFAPLIALEKGVGPGEAISQSISWVKDNFGQVFVILLVSYIVYIVGACLCGVGLLATVPIALVAITYTYRALNNELVVP